ncbi:uncharacterized protein LOC122500014 isoform X2 [Leptopilina heterotoma]|uniref:uncharacterized protein LOC122500014 isoform X2 n=1 Tax=Leptopilina heterotoma TaxID=63436 RepID=UPI001CA814AA|nr:uncharacterized protein LOC122500014 isoform X2 [Leptopilina heterotoma]
MVWKTLHLLSALVIVAGNKPLHIIVKEGNETYKTIFCPLPQIVQVLSVTYTTCNIFWNKPIFGDKSVNYDIYPSKGGENLTSLFYTTSLKEIPFSISNLEPGSKYKITVISKIYNQILTKNSTDCITRSNIESSVDLLNVTNTSCKIYVKTSIDDNQSVRYYINLNSNSMYTVYITGKIPFSESIFTFKDLVSGDMYEISVQPEINNWNTTAVSTKCITKSQLDLLKLISVTNSSCTVTWTKPANDQSSILYFIAASTQDWQGTINYFKDFKTKLFYAVKNLNSEVSYNITVYYFIDGKKFSLSTTCETLSSKISKGQLQPLNLLNVTSTSCTILWRKPMNDNRTVIYYVSVKDNKFQSPINYYETSESDVPFTIYYLSPGFTYDLSVQAKIDNQFTIPISTKCITL